MSLYVVVMTLETASTTAAMRVLATDNVVSVAMEQNIKASVGTGIWRVVMACGPLAKDAATSLVAELQRTEVDDAAHRLTMARDVVQRATRPRALLYHDLVT